MLLLAAILNGAMNGDPIVLRNGRELSMLKNELRAAGFVQVHDTPALEAWVRDGQYVHIDWDNVSGKRGAWWSY
jgi:hypothetical protein